MMMHRRAVVCAAYLFALCCGIPARSQQGVNAALEGAVLDSSGAVMPNVTVTLRNVNSGVRLTTQTDAQGDYHFLQLQPAEYSVRAEAVGFAPIEVTHIVLTIGQQVSQNLT